MILGVSVILMATLIPFGVYQIKEKKDLLVSSLQEKGEAIVKNLSNSLALPIAFSDTFRVQSLIFRAKRDQNIAYAQVFDDKGKALVSEKLIFDGKDFKKKARVKKNGLFIFKSKILREGKDYGRIKEDQKNYLGSVEIGIDLKDIRQKMKKETLQTVFILGAIILLVIICISWFLSRYCVTPLLKLSEAAEHLDDEAYYVNTQKNDEIGRLGRAFVKMRTMANQQKAELEEKVEKKTKELNFEKSTLEEVLNHTHKQKKSRDQLLGNLNQGYLTFGQEGVIYDGATKITEDFLETELLNSEMAGLTIWEVLCKSEEEKDHFKKWLEMVYDGKLAFKDIRSLVPQTFQGEKGTFIELDFRPIYEKDSKTKIEKMIMIASDKTKEIELQRIHDFDKKEVEFIKTCIQNPLDFIDLSNDTMEIIDECDFMEDHHLYHDTLFRTFHTLKARFGQFKQVEIINKMSAIEDILENKNYHHIKGAANSLEKVLKDLLKKHRTMIEACNKLVQEDGAAISVLELNKKLEYIKTIEELKHFLYHNYTLQDMKGFFQKFSYIIDHVSGQQGKSIDFVINGDEVKVDKSKYSDFLNVSIHLFRNMVDHGIETEDERIEKNKPEKGTIEVQVKLRENFMVILIEDNGRGIDTKKVKEKVLEKGLKTEEELKTFDPLELIFIPGLSTRDEVTEYSGRGVGMDAVKEEVLKLKGNISVSSVIDEGTSFKIQLPLLK